MTDVTVSLRCFSLLCVFMCLSAEQKIITAESGQNVTLTGRAPNNITIIAVQWNRADLWLQYVLLYRDDQFDPDNQHPSYKNRVDLKDRQMKDGDVSLILKNVMINDTGTYECIVVTKEKRSPKLIESITLRVDPPPGPGGAPVGLIVGLSVAAVLLVAAAVVVFFIYRKLNQNPNR